MWVYQTKILRREHGYVQRLPDFLMLDFCEWIKHSILSLSLIHI